MQNALTLSNSSKINAMLFKFVQKIVSKRQLLGLFKDKVVQYGMEFADLVCELAHQNLVICDRGMWISDLWTLKRSLLGHLCFKVSTKTLTLSEYMKHVSSIT